MPQAVLAEAGLVREAASTLRAGINLGHYLEIWCGASWELGRGWGVHPLVQGILLLVQKAFPTFGAHKRSLPGQSPFLDDDGCEVSKIPSLYRGLLETPFDGSCLPINCAWQALLRELEGRLIPRLWQCGAQSVVPVVRLFPRMRLSKESSICRGSEQGEMGLGWLCSRTFPEPGCA